MGGEPRPSSEKAAHLGTWRGWEGTCADTCPRKREDYVRGRCAVFFPAPDRSQETPSWHSCRVLSVHLDTRQMAGGRTPTPTHSSPLGWKPAGSQTPVPFVPSACSALPSSSGNPPSVSLEQVYRLRLECTAWSESIMPGLHARPPLPMRTLLSHVPNDRRPAGGSALPTASSLVSLL